MADVHEPSVRSYNMSQIRSKNTKPEMYVRRFVHANGFRFRLHDSSLPGKPDLVLKKYRTVIFIHGCFWHGHRNCKYFILPKTNTDWWKEKISKNRYNDEKSIKALMKLRWNVIEIWECELKDNNKLNTIIKDLKLLKPKF
jgi:DNA mismatch endonuclease, patch repair protein